MNDDKRRKRRAGLIMFGSFVGIAAAVSAIVLPLTLNKDDEGDKTPTTNPGTNPGTGTGGTGTGTGGTGTASYSYDFTAAGVANPTQLYEKAGEPGAYTDKKEKADGYKPEIIEKHPAFVVNGHRMAASVPGGSAYDASQ